MTARGWLESRGSSGGFMPSQAAPPKPPVNIDAMILSFVRTAPQAGWSDDQIRARVDHFLGQRAPEHALLIEPEPELRAIYATELAAAISVSVMSGGYEALDGELAGALVVATRAR